MHKDVLSASWMRTVALLITLISRPVAAAPTSMPIDPPPGTPVVLALDSWTPAGGSVPLILQLDDGIAEAASGADGPFVWFNRFTPDPSVYPFQLEMVDVVIADFGAQPGDAIEVVIHEDLDGDGDPGTGAVQVGSLSGTVVVAGANGLNRYVFPQPIEFQTPGDVLIGVVNRYSTAGLGDFPAAKDNSSSLGRSWAGGYASGTVPAQVSYPSDDFWGTVDDFGLPGNWMIRGLGTTLAGTPPANVPILDAWGRWLLISALLLIAGIRGRHSLGG